MVMGTLNEETDVAILGAGPGGYVAALRAADLGREVVLVDERDRPGGTCLLEGCIPSKTLIHAVGLITAAREAETFGLSFDGIRVDLDRLRAFNASVVSGLAEGVSGLLERRGVTVIHGRGRFSGPGSLQVEGGPKIDFQHAIIATGSRPRKLPLAGGLPLWDSTSALALPRVPGRLIVVGGGYIGLELGLVYAGLGSQVTVVEFLPELLVGADPDLVKPVVEHARSVLAGIHTQSKVVAVERTASGYAVTVEEAGVRSTLETDEVLVSVGRAPNSADLGLDAAGVELLDRGLVRVDEACRTTNPRIFAIGDVTPGPMLAHKASREAKVAAEVIANHPSAFDNRAIPAVVFTDPEIAWVGLTEREATEANRPVTVGRFPMKALGRARTLARTEGLVKVIADPESKRVLGVGIVSPMASDLIAEATLAIEMGATLEDLMVTIHPHPTLSEAVMEAAEAAAGMPVHLNPPRRR